MFSLTEKNEVGAIEWEGETLSIDCSFNNVLEVLKLMKSEDYSLVLKIELAFAGLVTNFEAFEDVFDLLEKSQIVNHIFSNVLQEKKPPKITYDRRGEPMPVQEKGEDDKEESFSFEHDASYIYTSFMQAYGIDLHEQFGVLSWQKFRLLLRDLPSDTKFKEVVRIREWEPEKGTSAKDKAKMREAQEYYALPEKR